MILRKSQRTGQDLVTRYEAKYIIPRERVAEVRSFIKAFCLPDPHASGDPPEYVITTLQLETPGYALHYAKVNEAAKRFKLRVRTYGEIAVNPVFAEVKAKLDDTIIKARASIPFGTWGRDLIFGIQVPDCFDDERQEVDFLKFKRLVWELQARPEMVVRYIRESYIGASDQYARVTFDRKLQYQVTDSWTDFGRSGVWRNMDSTESQGFGLPYSGVVLEVKALSYVPLWIMDLVKRFELRRSGNCKFSTAVWREGFFRRYPETNAESEEMLAWL